MPDVAIIIPTMGRPHRIGETVQNVAETSDARCHFVIEATDTETREAIIGEGLDKWTEGDFGTYAKCINAGYKDCPEAILMTSDDDCVYHEGWLEAALDIFRSGAMIVGTNDLHNPHVLAGKHSTHSLVDRRYLDELGAVIDQGPGSFMFEYDHNYTDAELVETAKARGVFTPCLESVVEHIHPEFGGRPPDETWHKTRRAVQADYDIFCQRRKLWEQADMPEYRDNWVKL
jgi:hypothetical protein